jgi:hypothetical protein
MRMSSSRAQPRNRVGKSSITPQLAPSSGATCLTMCARTRNQTTTLANLSRRPAKPALGNGAVQKACRRALWALGTASTSSIIEFCYARRLLLLGARRKNDLNRGARRALVAIGARRIGRASTRGRPWRWRLGSKSGSANEN